jgi:glycerophosphoryl diester phosphodiesterase
VLSFFLLTPLLSWAVAFMISSQGRLSVGNAEILSFVLSLRGAFFVLLVGSLTVVTLYVKHAGMMLIVWESHAGRRMGALGAFWAVLCRLPALTVLGAYHVAAHAVLLAPVLILAAIGYHLMQPSLPVYFLFLENTTARWLGFAIALGLVAATLAVHGAVYLHWAFSLPALLVDDLSAGSALKYTRDLLKGTRRRVGAVVFSVWLLIALLPFVLAEGFHLLGGKVFAGLPSEHRLVVPVVLMLMAGYLAASFLGEFLTVAVNSLTIIHLYSDLHDPHGATRTELSARHRSHPAHPRQVAVFLALAVVVSVAAAATILSGFDLRDGVQITAHRGSSFLAPENTIAAIRQAIEDGAHYAEIDVRLTADGYVVLLHDRDLFRVAGVKRNVADVTYQEIRTLDVGTWFSPRFREERIPLLSDVVALAKGRIRLNIEIKTDDASPTLVERVVQILHEQDAVERCVVSSAGIDVLERLRSLDPSIRTGYIISQSLGPVTALDVDFLSVSSRLATPGLIGAARAGGKQVHVWTVNKPRQMARLIDLGVDNIITDLPGTARALLEERAGMSDDELLFVKVRHWFLQ